jgi:hypothetical protein
LAEEVVEQGGKAAAASASRKKASMASRLRAKFWVTRTVVRFIRCGRTAP